MTLAARDRAPSWRITLALLLTTGVLGGCAALQDDMQRALAAYEAARYEDTLVWLTDLERDAPSMDVELRAKYFYLRGMTEYRLGHRAYALHYLAVAREVSGDGGAGLRPEWRDIMNRTLVELTPRGMSHRPPPENGEPPEAEATSGGEAPPEAEPAEDERPPA